MDEAKKRIFELESKLRELEARMPKKHPDVRFLNYQARKRILVSETSYSALIIYSSN